MQQVAEWLEKHRSRTIRATLCRERYQLFRSARSHGPTPKRDRRLVRSSSPTAASDSRTHQPRERGSEGPHSDCGVRRPGHRRAPPSHGDVLGPCRFDRTLGAHGPGGPARGHFRLSEMRRRDRTAASAGSWPSIWATASSSTSAIRRRMRTTPSGRCGLGWS